MLSRKVIVLVALDVVVIVASLAAIVWVAITQSGNPLAVPLIAFLTISPASLITRYVKTYRAARRVMRREAAHRAATLARADAVDPR